MRQCKAKYTQIMNIQVQVGEKKRKMNSEIQRTKKSKKFLTIGKCENSNKMRN